MAATGFFYGKHDFLITAGHVAAFASPADNITIRFQHSEEEVACTTVFVSSILDFAVLRVAKPIPHSFLYCTYIYLSHGMNIYAIGYQDNNLKMSKGTVTSKRFQFFTDAKTDSGFSGGVILYAFIPEVIGVIKDCVGEVSFVTNFIPCAMIYPAINDFNRSATTIKIPNLDQYNWPNSYWKLLHVLQFSSHVFRFFPLILFFVCFCLVVLFLLLICRDQ